MKKIEKLEEFNWVSGRDAITIALCNTIIRKQNEIIDHLNSQDQAEEKDKFLVESRIYPERTLGKLIKETLEDTPEQKEEWEEELGKLMSTWGKVLFVNKGRIGAGMQTAMYLKFYHFIKNLLSEREREVVETIKEIIDVKSIYQENGNECGTPLELIEWYVDTELDKLNK